MTQHRIMQATIFIRQKQSRRVGFASPLLFFSPTAVPKASPKLAEKRQYEKAPSPSPAIGQYF